MNNFELHERAQELADTHSAYRLARMLLEQQEGKALVPTEPTQEMLVAARNPPLPAVMVDSLSAMEDMRNAEVYQLMVKASQN